MNPLSSSTAANLKDLFCPSIGLLCSADVHQILDQHGISPYQLFYQYRQLKCEGIFRNYSSSTNVKVSNIKLNVRDINKSRRFMRNIQQDLLYNYIAQGNKDAFEFMCHNTLENSPHYSHEYLTQFLGCIFVVSTNNFDPIEEFRNLDQSVSWDSGDWFNEPCKFYVLLHYSTSLTNEYGNILDQMKLIYRTHNCELFVFEQIVNEDKIDLEVKVECEVEGDIIHDYIDLSACQVLNVEANVNAAQLSNGVVNFDRISTEFAQFKEAVLMRTHNYENRIDASCLFGKVQYKTNSSLKRVSISQNTHKNIGYLLEQFFFRCLLPWLDRRLRQLVEQTSTKRGVFKYITATRRSLFNVTGKVMTSESTPGSSLNSPHSTDLNHRRLADLLFLFRDYESAYSAYHALKKDFSYAPIYQASSLEMCAIAHVLAFPSKPVQHSYLRHALSIYASITDDSIRFELTLRCCALASLLLEQSRHYVLLVSFYITPFTMNYPLESAVLLDKCCFSNVEHGILKLIMMEPITAICYESAGLLSNAIACLRSFLTKFQNTSWVDLQVAIKTLLAQYLLRKDNKCASEVYELINSCSLCGLKFASNYVAASYLKVCDNLFELDYYIPQLFPLVIYDSIHVVNILPKSPLSEEIFSTSHCSINHLIDEFKLMHRIAFVDGTLSHEQCIHPIKLNDSFALILKLKAVINLDYFIEIIGFKSRIDQLLEDIKLNDSSVLAIFEDEFSEITIRCTCIKAGIFAVRFIFCKLMFDDVNNEYQDLYLNIPIFQGSEEYLLFECTDIIPSVTICDDTTRQQFGIKIEGQLSCIHIVAANFSSHSYLIYPRDHCCIFKDGKQLIERTALAMDASKYNIMSFTNNVDIQLSFISRRNIQLPLLFTCKSNNKDRHRYKFVGIYLKHDIKSIAIMKTDRIENNFITVQISNLQNPNNEFNYVMQPILFRLMRTNEFFSGLSMVSTHAAVKIQKGQTLNLLFQAIEADDKNKNLNERSTNNCDFFHDGDNNTVWMFNKFSLHEVVTKSLQTFSSKSLNNDSSILLLYRLIIFQGAELLCILVSNLNNDNYQNFANKSILNDITHKSLPCTISVDVPVLITHDFSKQSLCLIPIQLEVTNNSENLVRFCYQLKNVYNENTIKWYGKTTCLSGNYVRPGEKIVVHLTGKVSDCGLFHLSGIYVSVDSDEIMLKGQFTEDHKLTLNKQILVSTPYEM